MVLLADSDGGADETVSQHALVDHCVAVAGAVPADVAVDDGVGRVAVSSWEAGEQTG